MSMMLHGQSLHSRSNGLSDYSTLRRPLFCSIKSICQRPPRSSLGGVRHPLHSHRRRMASAQPRVASSDAAEMISDAERFIQSVAADELAGPASATVELQGQVEALRREVRG